MSKLIKIAIDTGCSGALASQFDDGKICAEKWDGLSEFVNTINSIMSYANTSNIDVICILEKVHSMPGQGVASTFKFGENFGMIQGVLSANSISYKLISPQAWMKQVGGLPKDKKARKNALKEYSARMYPCIKRVTLANADALAMLSVIDKVW